MVAWLGWICGGLAALYLIAGCWCLIELLRKWRSAPELWGIDWLDIVYRLERAFGVALTGADFARVPAEVRAELTAGQLWEIVADRVRATEAEVPADGWERVVMILSEALSVRPEQIAPDSRLFADLGAVRGLE
jgi:hypothetical protein